MMNSHRGFTLVLVLLLVSINAISAHQRVSTESDTESGVAHKPTKTLGFSGGMLFHAGYLFASSPDELFRNMSLKDMSNISDLPRDGFTLGLGGALRLHIKNHIHLGAEGGVSTMPLMKSGSNIRTGWGGALCDYYFTIGRVRPMIGGLIGGGSNRRLYVPSDGSYIDSGDSTLAYNASYVKTPFFFLDPYLGVEIQLSGHSALVIKADYMLPFSRSKIGVAIKKGESPWSVFVTPSGPRLYVGVLFGH